MSFFEPRDVPEPGWSAVPEPPGWTGRPRDQIGGPVPIRLVLARTDDVVVAVLGGAAYPSGFEFVVSVRLREPGGRDDPFDLMKDPPEQTRSDERFRFGVELSDGGKATSVGTPGATGHPEGPVLLPLGGEGGSGSWDQEYWLWPLPPPGPMAFVCEWPARGIPFTRQEIDAALVRDATEHAETLWPAPPLTDHGVRSSTRTARGPATPPESE